jgi:FdrA protein
MELTADERRTTNDGVDAALLGKFALGQRYLRGLFSGGTLAYEAQYILQSYLPKVWANAPLNKADRIPNSLVSQEHTIIDLGEDEFTVGRLHPMMDNELRIRRLHQEAADPETAVILLDVVIGYGSHPNPAGELAPAIAKAKATAAAAGRYLEVIAVITGTDEDPQNFNSQIEQLRSAGAWVDASNEAMVRYAGRLLRALNPQSPVPSPQLPVDLATLQRPLSAINVGLESFAENLIVQGVPTIQVDWRPPAGGNEKLMMILERMKGN